METFQSENDLGGVKPGPVLRKLGLFSQMEEKFASVEEVDHKVKTFRRLERVVELHNEWVINALQNHAFD